MNEVTAISEVAKNISDYGALIVTGATFIVLSIVMWVAIFNWFKTIINQILDQNKTDMQEILQETKKQNEMLCDVSEGLRTKPS